MSSLNMYFVFTEIIFPLVLSLLILIPAGLAGLFVIQKVLKIKLERNLLISLSTVLGYAIVAGLVVAVTTLKIFSIWFFGFLFLLVLLFNRKELAKAFIEFKKVFLALSSWKKTDLFLLFGIGIFFLFYLLTALSPPFQCDELAYHIPESIKIIQEGIFSLGGVLDICGNYPLLMESLYGLLFKIGGYSLVHLIHYQIVLATLLGLYAVGSKKFSRRAGLLFVLLCFTLYEFFMNSVSGYIDAASACFEILAVLIFLDININNKADRNKLVLSGILFGVALSIKSTVLYSLLAILIIGFLKFLKSENKKQVLAMFFWFIASFVLVGCFWYLKTWIMAGNPLYPFLGEGSQSQDIVPTLAVQGRGGLQLFGEGVLRVFKTPLQFLEPYYILSFLAFLTLPFLVFVKKEKKWIVSLLFFVLVYFSLWGLTT
ncbi:MAG: glycosyltransferase family 39 protein, partial [Candidatus Gribaldobacteria bacterium]|nr:glycosyltransferase family 39 protein [Candidatus Gribaldobacteria bacterium]